ncbi:UNVERIFIED_CONTAM: hypothetical protein Sradi_7199300 [Sesamum radiatum]|uniref:Reverse transcriptase domain-containing protein n=1 Tax=Sesamum radiatum TaxID=300843 RepID=A0AAW2IQS4_SESRA
MSPFLFVLVMEVLSLITQQIIDQDGGFSYHWRCGDIRLFQLGFADDLLLFSKAETASVLVFKRALTMFADLSGLHANIQKSHLILSRAALPLRDALLATLDFQEGHLPLRYLGLPLLASRLTIADCQPILRKIDDRIKGWEGIMLSFAGRVQLIKSVLSALQVYWAMAFILPKHIIKEIEKRLRRFLWKGSTDVGYAKVSWQQIGFSDTDFGRLYLDDFGPYWYMGMAETGTVAGFIATVHPVSSWGWYYLLFWHDPWHERGPLILRFPSGPRHTAIPAPALLCAVISEGEWNWPPILDMESMDITHSLPTIHEGRDRIIWTGPGGCFSSAAAYAIYAPPFPKVVWSSLLVGTFKIPRQRFILWLAILHRLSTLDRPWLQHMGPLVFYVRTIYRRHTSTCSSLAHLLQHVFRPSGAPFSFPGQFVTGHRRSVGRTEMARQACGKCLVQGFVGFPCLSSLA